MNRSIRNITGIAIFTAIVIILQMLGSFIRFGVFSISLVLIPIVVGAALYGPYAGAWLGFVFGMTVLLSGDAASFLVINVYATIFVVLLKGTLCGFLSGIVYRVFSSSQTLAAVMAAITCPVVNTGIFLLGCQLFFLPTIKEWANAFGFDNVYKYMLVGFVGMNFIFELLSNIVLSPVIVRVIRLGNKDN